MRFNAFELGTITEITSLPRTKETERPMCPGKNSLFGLIATQKSRSQCLLNAGAVLLTTLAWEK